MRRGRFSEDQIIGVLHEHKASVKTADLGPKRFVGYRDATPDTEALTPEGWLRTGDIGVLDEDGYLAVTDRKKDIIIRGGENIASREVEDLLLLMPQFVDTMVAGAPDPALCEKVCVFVQLAPGASLSLDQVRDHFSELRVARQKTPELLHFVADLPRNTAGKVLKAELRDRLR